MQNNVGAGQCQSGQKPVSAHAVSWTCKHATAMGCEETNRALTRSETGAHEACTRWVGHFARPVLVEMAVQISQVV